MTVDSTWRNRHFATLTPERPDPGLNDKEPFGADGAKIVHAARTADAQTGLDAGHMVDCAGRRIARVTREVARALGLRRRTGSVEAGKDCDLAIWDSERLAEFGYRIGFDPLHGRDWQGK
jgi:N-acyl-D-aspartate/D-glutamate deacylase